MDLAVNVHHQMGRQLDSYQYYDSQYGDYYSEAFGSFYNGRTGEYTSGTKLNRSYDQAYYDEDGFGDDFGSGD